MRWQRWLRPVTYFCAIGIGFMLDRDIADQRLMVFLAIPSRLSSRCSRFCCSAV